MPRSGRSRRHPFVVLTILWCSVAAFVWWALHNTDLGRPTGFFPSNWSSGGFSWKQTKKEKFRILHIVTTLRLYDNGQRGTTGGSDRLAKVLLPCLSLFLQSIRQQQPKWEVDVYIILGESKLESHRRKLIENSLPPGVGLQIWVDAMPLHYDYNNGQITPASHALARQHRFVIRDKLNEYDFFSAWEDDMAITANHIEYFVQMTNQIESIRKSLQKQQQQVGYSFTPDNPKTFHGPMHADQLERVVPGFIRVEVLSDGSTSQPVLDPISIAPDTPSIHADICCSSTSSSSSSSTSKPALLQLADNVVLWETSIEAIGVRQFPEPIGWAGLLIGIQPADNKNATIGSFWSGEDGAFGKGVTRPGRKGEMMAQQAGFMATRAQIDLFQNKCPGGFLPPFDSDFWNGNGGLKPQNVEFWSGGYQLFGRCFLQRIVSLDPPKFSRQLLFHSANNKQRTIDVQRMVKANNLLGQMHTVRNNATKHLEESLSKK